MLGVGVGGTEIHPPAAHYEAISLWHNQASLHSLTGQNCMFAMYLAAYIIPLLYPSYHPLSTSVDCMDYILQDSVFWSNLNPL